MKKEGRAATAMPPTMAIRCSTFLKGTPGHPEPRVLFFPISKNVHAKRESGKGARSERGRGRRGVGVRRAFGAALVVLGLPVPRACRCARGQWTGGAGDDGSAVMLARLSIASRVVTVTGLAAWDAAACALPTACAPLSERCGPERYPHEHSASTPQAQEVTHSRVLMRSARHHSPAGRGPLR